MTVLTTQTILAIESAIGGGSIAIVADGSRIDGVIGPSSVSRAEDLLSNIDHLLHENDIDKLDLTEIIVSAGPGSFTGIRIGIATALGLGDALRIPVRQISLLEALAVFHTGTNEIAAALPVGRETICWQPFRRHGDLVEAVDQPAAVTIDEFMNLAADKNMPVIVVNGALYESIAAPPLERCRNAGNDLASLLARAVIDHGLADLPEPMFVGKRK